MKLVAYCRVSSVGQEDNTSLQHQEERIRAYCLAFGHELVAVLKEAKSGKDTARKEYQKMLDMLPEVDGVITMKLDRLTRSVKDLLALVDDVLKPANKALIVTEMQIDTSSPQGKMFLTVMGAMSEMERSLIAERCNAGRAAKKASGEHYGGGETRYGWKYDRDAKRMVKHDQEQEAIALMVKLYEVDGWLLREIADELNRLGIKTKNGQGTLWKATKISQIFKRLGKDKPVRKGALVAVNKERQYLGNISLDVKDKLTELVGAGYTQRAIAAEMNRLGLKSIKGGKFDQGLVSRVMQIVGI